MEKQLIWGRIEYPGYAVCIGLKGSTNRTIGKIYKIRKYSSDTLYYSEVGGTSKANQSDWRQAIPEEVNWHLKDPINNILIENMPKDVIVNSFPIY
jgi:hypothetical protein